MVLLLVFMQLTRDLFAIAKFLYETVLCYVHNQTVIILLISIRILLVLAADRWL